MHVLVVTLNTIGDYISTPSVCRVFPGDQDEAALSYAQELAIEYGEPDAPSVEFGSVTGGDIVCRLDGDGLFFIQIQRCSVSS